MAKQLKLSAQTRSVVGRTAVKKIKAQGLVPATIYGGHDQPVNLSLNKREISTLLAHATSEHFLVDLEIADGSAKSSRLALIQEVQHHPIRRDVLHDDPQRRTVTQQRREVLEGHARDRKVRDVAKTTGDDLTDRSSQRRSLQRT